MEGAYHGARENVMEKYFITGTGTGVGKTFITTTLCRQLIASEKKVTALKPVISGYTPDDMESDSALILKSCNLPITNETIEAISPWRFSAPLAPNMAAELEGKIIDFKKLVDFCKEQEASKADILLVEGVGGVCVPLNNNYTVLDWIEALPDWKIILVAGSYLGSISHTITAVKALETKNLKLHALIVNESEHNNVGMEETIKTLEHFLPKYVLIIPVLRQTEKNFDKVPQLSKVCL